MDQTVAILWAAMAPPFFQMKVLEMEICAPVIVLYLFGAITTFVASHHTILGDDGKTAEGTDHLEHHLRFNVNFGNFAYFDKLNGSYGFRGDKEVGVRKWGDKKK